MTLKRLILGLAAAALVPMAAWADAMQDAYQAARAKVPEAHRGDVLSVYATGSPTEIHTWYFKFFDPEPKSNARSVVVENGKIQRDQPATDKRGSAYAFDPQLARVNAQTALKTAQKYAEKNQIQYSGTRLLLRRVSPGKAPAWTVELLAQNASRGYVYADPENGAYAGYRPPRNGKGEKFGDEVKDTFLGIGGDLEEFFTGDRSVDQ